VRKKVASKNARQLTAAAAADADPQSTYTWQVVADGRPTAGQKNPRRPTVAAAHSRAAGSTFRMHLRTVCRRNVRLKSLSPAAAQGGVVVDRTVTSMPAAATFSHRTGPQKTAAASGYHLWLKKPALRTCYGCKQRFAECYSIPPKDIIIRRFMRRAYKDSQTGTTKRATRMSATYFHLNMDCVRKVTSSANVKDIMVHDEVWPLLIGERVSRVQKFGMDIFPEEDST